MSVLDNNTIGTLESNIDVGEMLLPDNQIAIDTSYSNWCYPYIHGGVRLNTTFQGMGTIACIFVNGVFLNIQKADVDTVDIVDVDGTPTEATGQHKPSEILIFRSKK